MAHTWRRKNNLASWSLNLVDAREELQHWFHDTAVALVDHSLATGFAMPRDMAITTESGGEPDDVVALDPDRPAEHLAVLLAAHRDLEALTLTLALCCRMRTDGEDELLEDGADLFLSFDDGPDGSPLLHILLVLHVDIYAAETWGEERDNRVLAAINGPRLTAFLEGLQSELGATIDDIDAESYGDQAGPRGFRPPAGA